MKKDDKKENKQEGIYSSDSRRRSLSCVHIYFVHMLNITAVVCLCVLCLSTGNVSTRIKTQRARYRLHCEMFMLPDKVYYTLYTVIIAVV